MLLASLSFSTTTNNAPGTRSPSTSKSKIPAKWESSHAQGLNLKISFDHFYQQHTNKSVALSQFARVREKTELFSLAEFL